MPTRHDVEIMRERERGGGRERFFNELKERGGLQTT